MGELFRAGLMVHGFCLVLRWVQRAGCVKEVEEDVASA